MPSHFSNVFQTCMCLLFCLIEGWWPLLPATLRLLLVSVSTGMISGEESAQTIVITRAKKGLHVKTCVYIYIVKTVDKISGTTKSDASSVRLQGLKSPLWIQVSSPGGEQFDLTFSDKDTVLMLKKQLKATQSVPLRMAAIILTNYCNQLNCYSSWDLQSTLYQHCQIFEFGCETWLFTTYHCSYIRWGTWWSTIVFTFRRTQMMRMQLHRYLGGTLIGKTAKGGLGGGL